MKSRVESILPVFSHGFRPFFLSAVLFGLVSVPIWLLAWQGRIELAGPFQDVDWHVHEMLFGYAGAVVAGFLFTAVPNWTGQMPIKGWPLAVLAVLWLAGRISVAGLLPIGRFWVAAVDCGFLAVIAAAMARQIIAGRNWKNLRVIVPVSLLVGANVLIHLEAAGLVDGGVGRRLGIGVVIFLIMLIGGRIIPSFTRNWLAARGATALPVPFGRFDGMSLVAAAIALVTWVVLPDGLATAVLLIVAGVLHLSRLGRWRGQDSWASPLLLMLHVAYLFVPLGLLATGLAAAGIAPAAAGLHLLGIGAIGGMTVAVMMRATRGHTGRSLVAGNMLTWAFALICGAALARACAAQLDLIGLDGIEVAAGAWTIAFLMLAVRMAPWLILPSAGSRKANPAPGR